MRISEIEIHGLFNLYNHRVPLCVEERATIIHGQNGVGKTVMLGIINDLFSENFEGIVKVPFDWFTISFTDGTRLKVKEISSESEDLRKLSITYLVNSCESEPYVLEGLDSELNADDLIPWVDTMVRRYNLPLERAGYRTWLDVNIGEPLSIGEAHSRVCAEVPTRLREPHTHRQEKPDWLRTILQEVKVHFVEADRLVTVEVLESATRWGPRRPFPNPTVNVFSKDVRSIIGQRLIEYSSFSQSLDRSFPQRLLDRKSEGPLPTSALQEKFSDLEVKRQRLMQAGLMGEDDAPPFEVTDEMDQWTRLVMSIYVNDIDEKFGRLLDIAGKIELLTRAINTRLLNKRMMVTQREGFIFASSDGTRLPAVRLSSGEQHLLVLVYSLLFRVEPGSLILIDEPELSLHVAWQQELLDALIEIAKLADLDLLLATHSPDIIADWLDLTVRLQGENNEDT